LELVETFIYVADNNSQTDMARDVNQPPVRELGEVAEKYTIGTAEVLSYPQVIERYGKPNQGNAIGDQMYDRKSDCSYYRRNL
jgi:hypothetical protein